MNGSKMIFSGSLFSYLGGTASEKAIRTYSSEWISGNLAYLEHGGVKMIPWKDDPKRPFFMESLPEDIYQAFILKAASAVAGMPMLERIPHGFRSRRHPLVLKLMSSGDMIWEKTLFSVLFVPSPDMFTYRSSLPDIGELMASSTAALSELLQRINARSWNADPYTVISWSDETKDEGRKVLSGLVPDSESTIDGESAAKFAYSVLYRALMFSLSGGTPLIIGRVGRKNGRSKGRSKGMHSTEEG